MITTQEMIKLLVDMKFDEDLIMGNPTRQRRNDIIDEIIFRVGQFIGREDCGNPEREIDPDCPSGVCGTGGRV